jgi:hypothetical protein
MYTERAGDVMKVLCIHIFSFFPLGFDPLEPGRALCVVMCICPESKLFVGGLYIFIAAVSYNLFFCVSLRRSFPLIVELEEPA